MASYKVLQDIEAEDKLIGSLTLKQFIFGAIAATLLFIGWTLGRFTGLIILFIPAAPFLFLAAPIGRDQPNDVWLASRLRFWFKPRVRKWDQTGAQDLVTITAPKVDEHIFTDGLSRGEVQSRLKALATTIDSRGWAVKNAEDSYQQRIQGQSANQARLVQPGSGPQPVSDIDLKPWDDMLDGNNSPVGQHFQELIDKQTVAMREGAAQTVATTAAAANPTQTSSPDSAAVDEQAFLDKIHKQQQKLGVRGHNELASTGTLQRPVQKPSPKPAPAPVDPAIIDTFKDADDLKVSTIASMAKRASDDLLQDNEVINLH